MGRRPEPSEAERYKVPLLTKGDLAALMGVSTRTVERWSAEGLPTRSIGENRRFHPSEVADWLRDRFGMDVEDLITAVGVEAGCARRR
jgi:excisionase family DNA binding protein